MNRRGGVGAAAQRWAEKVTLGCGAAITVWAIYHPADSTAVEQGDSLGLTIAVLLWVLAAGIVYRIGPTFSWRQASWWCDAAAFGLAAWVCLSAVVTAGVFSTVSPLVGGDLRAATNEAWWWVAAAGFFVVVRRLMSNVAHAQAMFGLLLGLGTLLAVHTLHQHYVSFPQTMQEYLSDPDGTLANIGLEASAGSAARMIFENRLRDGGPTATFALANSLAGPLAIILTLAGGCFVCWRMDWRQRQPASDPAPLWSSLLLGSTGPLLSWALVQTSSRSGLLSVILVSLGSLLWLLLASRAWVRSRLVMASVAALGLAGVVLFWRTIRTLDPGSEMVGAAATIQLRLQYWRATLAMAGDAPWLGAGPGNFQLVYQKYRDAAAHELIAEPHNFLMETLASGGWVGVLLLITVGVAGGIVYSRSGDAASSEKPVFEPEFRRVNLAVGGGALLGLLSVWYLGIRGNDLPDFDAHLIAVPIASAVVAAWMMAIPSLPRQLTSGRCRGIALAATAAGLLHLCFSGGWTVPGVSVVLLWLAGTAVSVPALLNSPVSEPENQRGRPSAMPSRANRISLAFAGFAWCLVIAAMIVFSWRPVSLAGQQMAAASQQMQTNQTRMAAASLKQAMAVDPLNRDAPIWRATIENRAMIESLASGSLIRPRQLVVADEIFGEAVRRTGNDPVRLRAISDLLLHRYQVGGRVEDLAAANELLAHARELSPTHETITAQQAEVVRELQRLGVSVSGMSATQLAERADSLASSGGAVVTRQLALQPILVARVIGRPAMDAPLRMAADQVLGLTEPTRSQ